MRRDDVTAVILAGGAGRRLGGAVKPLIQIDGVRIVDRQLAVLGGRVREVVVSVQEAAAWTLDAGLRCIVDEVSDRGPLAGIAATLGCATTPWLLVVAGDMPWIEGDVVDAILDGRSGGASAVVPRVAGFPEPLLAAYHVTARAAIDAAVARGDNSPSRLLQSGALEVRWIDVELPRRCFTSVNSPADLA